MVVHSDTHNTFDEGAEHYLSWVASAATPVAIKLQEIQQQSLNDDEIKAVRMTIYEDQWTEKAMPYKTFKEDLCFAGDIILRGNRIVMPMNLRDRVITLAHEGHPGMTVMKRRLRSKVWWPKLDQSAENCVKRCYGCTLVAAPSAPEPMKRTHLPSKPWQHLAIYF